MTYFKMHKRIWSYVYDVNNIFNESENFTISSSLLMSCIYHFIMHA